MLFIFLFSKKLPFALTSAQIEPELEKLRAKLEGKKIAISPLLFFHSGVVPILLSDLKMVAMFILLEDMHCYKGMEIQR